MADTLRALSTNHIEYLTRVLGIDRPVWPRGTNLRAVSAGQPHGNGCGARLIVIVSASSESNLDQELDDLLQKILAAMQLQRSDILLFFRSSLKDQVSPVAEQAEGRPILLLGCDQAFTDLDTPLRPGDRLEHGGSALYGTHGLSDLIRLPDLKRQTWAHVQKLMKELSSDGV